MTDTISAPEYFDRMSEQGLWDSDADRWTAVVAAADEAAMGDDWDAETRLAWALYHTNQYREAEAHFLNVLENAPDTFAADVGYFTVLRDGYRQAEAVRYFRDFWTTPEKRFRQYFLSWALIDLGCPEQALALMPRWYDPNPTLDAFVILKARILAALGRWAEAAPLYALFINQRIDRPQAPYMFVRAAAKASGPSTHRAGLRACQRHLTRAVPAAWLNYQLARYCLCTRVKDHFADDPVPSVQVGEDFQAVTADSNLNLRLIDGADDARPGETLKTPTVKRKDLVAKIAAFKDTVETLRDDGRFNTWLHNVDEFQNTFQPMRPPVIVLSTGRCGTFGFQRFLERSANVLPFHSVEWQPSPADQNHLLYRILEGNLDPGPLSEILKTYLECRMAEILYAIRKNRALVIVRHLDTVFAPFMSVLFPESRFLHLHRAATKVHASMLTKRQWGDQLQHWRFDSAFPDGKFVFTDDPDLSVDAEIAWYLHLTATFAGAFFDTLEPGRHASIRSEDLFAREPSAFERLQAILPIDDLSMAEFEAAYAKKVNAKEIFVDRSFADIDARAETVRAILDHLDKTGTLAA